MHNILYYNFIIFHNFIIFKKKKKQTNFNQNFTPINPQLKKFSFNNFSNFPPNQKKYQFLLRSRKFKNLSSNFYTNQQEKKEKEYDWFHNSSGGKKTEESFFDQSLLGALRPVYRERDSVLFLKTHPPPPPLPPSLSLPFFRSTDPRR